MSEPIFLTNVLTDKNNAWVIYLLSAIISLLFGLMIHTLRRSARILQEKKWATPFACAFFALGAIHSLRFCNWLINPDPIVVVNWGNPQYIIQLIYSILSGVNSYLFFLSAFRLSEHAVDKPWLLPIKKWLTDRVSARRALLLLFCLAGGLQVIDAPLTSLPDTILSIFALFLMGFALYQNTDSSRDRLMAWIAVLSSCGYALLISLYGLKLVPPAVLSLLSLPLKCGLFFPAYSLMLSLTGPLEGMSHLLENVTRKQNEYLDSRGLMKSICEEFRLNRVSLYIMLPGSVPGLLPDSTEKQVALYTYPPKNQGNDHEPLKFKYEKGTDFDDVIKLRETSVHNRDDNPYSFIRRMSKVTVPIFYHDAVIACLKAEIGEVKFTEADLSNLKRVATFISPSVQAYREMEALNKINQDLAQLQIGVTRYDMEWDVEQITKIIHDVISPSAAGVSIEIGFSEYLSTHPQNGHFGLEVKEQLTEAFIDEVVMGHNANHRWLKKGLRISGSTSENGDEQLFGKFVFGTEQVKQPSDHPTIGTNHTCRRAISDLMTDILLDFIRGHLNQLTDDLGAGLSGLQGTTAEGWLKEVEDRAKDARLLWTVASYSDDNQQDADGNRWLGDSEIIALVKRQEEPERKEKWEMKDEGLWLCSLDQMEAGTYHIIKMVLKRSQVFLQQSQKAHGNSQATLWLGVARQGFGPELGYVSPWKFFLNHFCEIADSALLRILINEKQKKRMGEVQSIIAGTLTTGTLTHDLATAGRVLVSRSTALEDALEDKERRNLLLSEIRGKRDQIERLLPKFTDIYKRDLRQPCPLSEAIERAIERVGISTIYDIQVNNELPSDARINIPFDAAVNALVIVMDNGKDSIKERLIKDRESEKGLIQIHVQESEAQDYVFCDITDNGLGVPPHVQATLLKEVTKSKKDNSHGVGLLFSVDLLRLYNGDILLIKPGQPEPGTTFRITFPK